MEVLQDLTVEELKTLLGEYGEKPFHAAQIFRDLQTAKNFRTHRYKQSAPRKTSRRFCNEPIEIIGKKTSKADGTEKYLFRLHDGNVIEGVLMKYKYGNTQCVSTQVGCRMGCKFCASTLGGLIRNLTAGEIAAQIYAVNRLAGGNTDKERLPTSCLWAVANRSTTTITYLNF